MLKPKGHQRCHGRFLDDATFLPLAEQAVKHLEAYAGAARAFDSYQIALEIFAETTGNE